MIKTLGPARIEFPLAGLLDARQTTEHYVDEDDRVLLDDTLGMVRARGGSPTTTGCRESSAAWSGSVSASFSWPAATATRPQARRRFVHIPMALAVSKRNQVGPPHGDL